jgi:hypothetical protein
MPLREKEIDRFMDVAREKKLRDGWTHTASIDPALWIESMENGRRNPYDMLYEIQFTK